MRVLHETHHAQQMDIDTGQNVAIRLEHVSIEPSLLMAKSKPIARVRECEYNAIMFDLLGPNPEDLFNYYDCKFFLKNVLMLANQLLYLHQDIKPELLDGRGKHRKQVYITDLGLATA